MPAKRAQHGARVEAPGAPDEVGRLGVEKPGEQNGSGKKLEEHEWNL